MLRYVISSRIALHSVLVVRHGKVALEAYARGFSAEAPQPINSCTKSLTSALIGIALRKGLLQSIEQRVIDFFPADGADDPRKASITIAQLLGMTSGLAWDEWESPNASDSLLKMEKEPDRVGFVLSRPLEAVPGSRWNYNTGGSEVISAILQKVTGKKEADFARENLLGPLGITSAIWPTASDGTSFGGYAVRMTSRDMARFGYLYLREGRWMAIEIVPASWVRESTARRMDALEGQGYALHWWVTPFGGYDADGYGGQRIFVLPVYDLVVVLTADLDYPAMMRIPESLVRDYVIAAVQSAGALPDNPAGRGELETGIAAFGK